MPEVKRREIQRRKHRRERLWRGDNNDDGENGIAAGGGDGALKRAARKILVKQLKELREKEAKMKKNKKMQAHLVWRRAKIVMQLVL